MQHYIDRVYRKLRHECEILSNVEQMTLQRRSPYIHFEIIFQMDKNGIPYSSSIWIKYNC